MPVAKGTPLRKLTPEQTKALLLCPPEMRSRLLKRWRQREAARIYRAQNREACLARARAWKKRATQRGYYKATGRGYRNPPRTEKRREYQREYHRNARLKRKLVP